MRRFLFFLWLLIVTIALSIFRLSIYYDEFNWIKINQILAGVAGFEPADDGTKNRCLTTLGDTPTDAKNVSKKHSQRPPYYTIMFLKASFCVFFLKKGFKRAGKKEKRFGTIKQFLTY